MGLNLALKAHSEGNLVLAEEQYKRALDQNTNSHVLYQNYGALLRSLERIDESIKCYQTGLDKYPNNVDIMLNYANILRESHPVSSLELYLKGLILISSELPFNNKRYLSTLISCSQLMFDLGLYSWNVYFLKSVLPRVKYTAGVLLNVLLLLDRLSDKSYQINSGLCKSYENVYRRINQSLSTLNVTERIEFHYSLFHHSLLQGKNDDAFSEFDKANKLASEAIDDSSVDQKKLQNLIDCHHWNGANTLLKIQDFDKGWKYYEYGLRAPCSGPQRWQRSLAKPFTSSQVQLWKGESLKGKRLLLLEEQGIGDAMMFISLVPALIKEATNIGLFLSDRLLAIYKRSFKNEIESGSISVFSRDQFYHRVLQANMYDFQSPMGSVCQYRFHHPSDYSPRPNLLSPDQDLVQQYRKTYLSQSNIVPTKIVGISWRGGAKATRMKQKSVDTKYFFDLMKLFPDILFVSLQYGESKKITDSWKASGINVIHDDSINPLKNMDTWISQVAACDAVVSVANTTIHGAGGLNIPTICLLSKHSDWRWIDSPDVQRSYWYPSVGIARQSSDGSWSKAFNDIQGWFYDKMPYPQGAISL